MPEAARTLITVSGGLTVMLAVLNFVDTLLGRFDAGEYVGSLIMLLIGGALVVFGARLIGRNPVVAGLVQLLLGLLCLLEVLGVAATSVAENFNSYFLGLLSTGLYVLAGILLVVGGVLSFLLQRARPRRIG